MRKVNGHDTQPESVYIARNLKDNAVGLFEKRAEPTSPRRVVVVAGYFQYGIGPFRSLRDRFRKEDQIVVIPMNVYFWRGIKESAKYVAEQVSGIDTVDALVGHSMGGLIASKVAQTPGVGEKIRSLVCLSTPFRGTPKAYLVAFTRSGRQMLPSDGGLLEEIREGEYPERTRVISVYGDKDWIVPPDSAHYEKAHENIALRGLGHAGILYSSDMHDVVRREVLRK